MLFRNVQGLRALAALAVVAVHIGSSYGFEARYVSPAPLLMRPFSVAGLYGVDLFFVISGFIMTITTWNSFGDRTLSGRFLLRRILRIYPAYWLVLLPLVALYLFKPGLINAHAETPPNVLASILLFPQTTPLLLVSWSLVFEMAFYFVFALAICFKRRYLPLVLAAWFLAIAGASFYFGGTTAPLPQFLASPLPLEFFFGIAAGALVMRGTLRYPVASSIAGALCVGAAVSLGVQTGNPDFPSVWIRVMLAGFGFSSLLYGIVVAEKTAGLLLPGFMDHLGDASYALYLWHIPVLTALGLIVVRLHAHGLVAHLALVALAFGCAITVALFVYRFVESPLTKTLQRRLTSPSRARSPGIFVEARELHKT